MVKPCKDILVTPVLQETQIKEHLHDKKPKLADADDIAIVIKSRKILAKIIKELVSEDNKMWFKINSNKTEIVELVNTACTIGYVMVAMKISQS